MTLASVHFDFHRTSVQDFLLRGAFEVRPFLEIRRSGTGNLASAANPWLFALTVSLADDLGLPCYALLI